MLIGDLCSGLFWVIMASESLISTSTAFAAPSLLYGVSLVGCPSSVPEPCSYPGCLVNLCMVFRNGQITGAHCFTGCTVLPVCLAERHRLHCRAMALNWKDCCYE